MAGGLTEPLAAEPLEWLEKAVDLVGRNERSGVADGHDRPAVGDGGGDLGASAGQVVPDGIAHQVGQEALRQDRVAGGRAPS